MTVTEWESGSYETASNGRGSGDGRCSGVVDSPTVSPVDRVSKQASPVPRPVNSSDPASSSEPKVVGVLDNGVHVIARVVVTRARTRFIIRKHATRC